MTRRSKYPAWLPFTSIKFRAYEIHSSKPWIRRVIASRGAPVGRIKTYQYNKRWFAHLYCEGKRNVIPVKQWQNWARAAYIKRHPELAEPKKVEEVMVEVRPPSPFELMEASITPEMNDWARQARVDGGSAENYLAMRCRPDLPMTDEQLRHIVGGWYEGGRERLAKKFPPVPAQ